MRIITISGASGSGKTTLADFIHKSLPKSLLLSLDRYYLSKKQQIDKNGFCNFDEPSSLDTDLLKEHITDLKNTGTAKVPIYDFTISERSGYEDVSATGTIIIDGLFAGAVLSELSDLNIFVDVDLDLALLRRIHRDMNERGRTLQSVTEQYMNFVRPAYFKHIATIKARSDIILQNNNTREKFIEEIGKVWKLLK